MVRTSSGRKGRGDTLSEANLLSPLPSAGDRETAEPPDVRQVLEAIHDLKAFIAGLPSPDATGAEALRQAAENIAASVGALRSDIREHADTNAGSARRIQETLAAIGEAIGGLAARLDAMPDREDPALAEGQPDDTRTLHDLLEAQAKALREMRNAVCTLTRAVEASRTETAGLRHELGQANGTGSGLQALDAWRDDFIRRVDALLARAKTAGEAPTAGQETAPEHADRIAARMDEAFDAVEATLKQHGDSLRRNEHSTLLTRKGVESLAMAFDRSGRECRLWRLAWVSPLVLLLAFAAGMLLESNVHWFYAWLSGR